jgi:hypothetical protein
MEKRSVVSFWKKCLPVETIAGTRAILGMWRPLISHCQGRHNTLSLATMIHEEGEKNKAIETLVAGPLHYPRGERLLQAFTRFTCAASQDQVMCKESF